MSRLKMCWTQIFNVSCNVYLLLQQRAKDDNLISLHMEFEEWNIIEAAGSAKFDIDK